MTEIEQISDWALTIAAEAAGTKLHHYERMSDDNRLAQSIEAHARAIEQHEAFRREVSDAVEEWHGRWVGAGESHSYFMSLFSRFIIAKPVDPFLIEAREVCARVEEERNNLDWATRYRSGQYDELGWVKHIRAALAARGLKIVEDKT